MAIDIPFSRCAACEQTWSNSSPALRPYSRSWYEAWRVKCGFCGRPFHLGVSSSSPNSDAVFVTDRLRRDAVDGSELFERYLLGRPCGWLPPRLIWLLTSIPVRRRRRCQMAFELIVPEASAPSVRNAAGNLRHDLPHHQPFQAGCHGEGLGLLENWLGCTLPKSQQEGGLSVGAVGPQGASQWRDYPRRRVRARSFAP